MAEVGIFVGTMYGNSLLVAEEAETILSGHGHKARYLKTRWSLIGKATPGSTCWW